MATVIIPSLLRQLTKGAERVSARGGNLGAVIEDLELQYPGIRAHLVDDDDLKGSVAAWIDGEVAAAGILTSVRENSEVHFVPAIGGG